MTLFGARHLPLWAGMLALSLCMWLAAPVAGAAAPKVPALEPVPVQDLSSAPLTQAERARLEEALAQNSGPEQYKILIIDSATPHRLEDYLDAVWAEWHLSADTVLLVVARSQGNAIRFYLGAQITGYGVTVDSAVAAIRTHYSPRVREGKLAEGLAALVADLHRQVLAGGGQPAGQLPTDTASQEKGAAHFRLPQWQWPEWTDRRLPLWLGAGGVGLIALGLTRYALALRRWRQGAQV